MTRKYAPKKLSDLVGNPKSHAQLWEMVRDGTPVLLTSGSGIGKTSAVYAVAEEHGYTVIETNASDERRKGELDEIAMRVQQESPFGEKYIFLLDEIDYLSAWATLRNMLQTTKHPIVMTANEAWRIPADVKEKCIYISLRRPRLDTVVAAVRKIAEREIVGGSEKIDYSNVGSDIRNAVVSTMYGGGGYEEKNVFGIVSDYFQKGNVMDVKENMFPWLFDNAPRYLDGIELFDFYMLLDVASRSSIEALRMCSAGRGSTYPKYPIFYRMKRKDGEGKVDVKMEEKPEEKVEEEGGEG